MHFTQVKKILIITLLLNWLVAGSKLFVGFMTGSLSILSDGFHSLFDGMSNILGLIGIKIAERPQDQGHPYGHRKFESLAALGIAFLILITGYELIKSTIERFANPKTPEITALSFAVMIGALIIDLFVSRYERKQGEKLKSAILVADSIHTKTHLFTTPTVILGMIAIRLGFPIFDPIMTALVILMLARLAWEIVGETVVVLCDRAFIDETKINEIAQTVEGVSSSHQVRTRGDEHHVFLDMHITLNSKFSLEEAHGISHILKDKIMKEIPQIKDVVIHAEPKM